MGDPVRITAKAKAETRRRILEVGQSLFVEKGFEATTTRDIARGAGLAAGTVFNYFASKEALAMTVLDEALAAGQERFRRYLRGDECLAEELFALIAAELREMRPHRGFVGPVLETAFSPFGGSDLARAGDAARVRHLESVGEILRRHGRAADARAVVMHLYWTLYIGVLAFWSKDESRHQEDSLAVLDQSMQLFVNAMDEDGTSPGK